MDWPLIAAGVVGALALFFTGGMPWTSRIIGTVVAAGIAFGGVHLWIERDLKNAGKRAEEHAKMRGAQRLQENEKLGLKRDDE